MGCDPDHEVQVPRWTAPALAALAAEPDPLSVNDSGRDVDLVAARSEADPVASAAVCLLDWQHQLGFLVDPRGPGSAAAPPRSEQVAEQVLEVDSAALGVHAVGASRPAP